MNIITTKTAHAPPPGKTPAHLTFLKNFGQISQCVGSLDGQMPNQLALQKVRVKSPTQYKAIAVEALLSDHLGNSKNGRN